MNPELDQETSTPIISNTNVIQLNFILGFHLKNKLQIPGECVKEQCMKDNDYECRLNPLLYSA